MLTEIDSENITIDSKDRIIDLKNKTNEVAFKVNVKLKAEFNTF